MWFRILALASALLVASAATAHDGPRGPLDAGGGGGGGVTLVSTYTSSDTIAVADLNCTTVVNTGALAAITLTLPTAVAGYCVEVVAIAAYTLDIDPAAGDQILDLTDSVGDQIQADGSVTPGASVRLKAIDEDYWIAVPSDPTNWSDED